MDDHTGERTSRGMRAPALNMRFKCPTCNNEDILDAYKGPPTCMGGRGTDRHLPVFMTPQAMVPEAFPL